MIPFTGVVAAADVPDTDVFAATDVDAAGVVVIGAAGVVIGAATVVVVVSVCRTLSRFSCRIFKIPVVVVVVVDDCCCVVDVGLDGGALTGDLFVCSFRRLPPSSSMSDSSSAS